MGRRWYLLRHGQTYANLSNIIQGGGQLPNLHLNDEGIRQAELTAEALAHTPFNRIYMSPAARTKQTAQKIFECHKPPILTEVLPSLLEINFGILEGKTFNEAEKLHPNLVHMYREKPSTCVFPGGERMTQAFVRISRAINYILVNTASNENVLIVSHGGVLALIFVYLFDLELDKMFHAIRHENCGFSIVEIEGMAWRKPTLKPQIIRMNDISHLLR